MLKRLLIVVCVIGWQWVGICQNKEAEDDLSLSAKSALQEMERSIQTAKRIAVDKLKRCMRSEMLAGNLNRANRISQEIEKLAGTTTEKSGSSSSTAITGVKWKSANNEQVTFKENAWVEWGEGSWSGTWAIEGGSVQIKLTKLNGKEAPSPQVFSLSLPRKVTEAGGQVIRMQAQRGNEIFTLTRAP